jgi:transketolase
MNTLIDITDPSALHKRATRDGYGDALVELGAKNANVFVLTADLKSSMRCADFAKLYPTRFIECGVAEQNMMGVAAGLAHEGKIPFVSSFAVFSPGRNWDQLRVSICYQRSNVKIIGGHSGLATGVDGATHQALEDIAITRVLPNLVVLSPCDAVETRKAVLAAAQYHGPVYIRISREPTTILTTLDTPFQIGKAVHVGTGTDVTLLSTGPLLYETMLAREMLGNQQISTELIHVHSIKPLDSEMIVKSARLTNAVVTIEDHQRIGGFGSSVAELLSQEYPVPQEFVGVKDTFGESGNANQLYAKHGLTARDIVAAVKKVLARKNHKVSIQ